MHINELIAQYNRKNEKSIPDWMIGCFKRRSISFANGKIDTKTHVFWLQGRNLTIDLRLPIEAEMITNQTWQECSTQEIEQLTNYDGWSADSTWQNNQLSWSGGSSFQIHNRWPEPAILSRVGDCMIEASPNESYIEDWRIKSKAPGALLSFELISEENLTTGELRHKGGALIINGDWAGLVLGRAVDITLTNKDPKKLIDIVKNNHTDKNFLKQVFNFETSVAQGSLVDGFKVKYSTLNDRLEQPLFELNGFEIDEQANEVTQTFTLNNQQIKRRFAIDTLEANFAFSEKTHWRKETQKWFDGEQEVLGRYLKTLT
jgi:hypothetical protein